MLKVLKTLAVLFILVAFSSITTAQELSTGVDVVSKYIWRGSDLGSESPAIQPSVKLGVGAFQFGFWGSTALAATTKDTAANEIDFFMGYTHTFENSSSLGILVTDYTLPSSGTKYGNFNNYDDPAGAGAHQIEVGLNYNGPASLPLSLSVNTFVYNLVNNPVYVELGYNTTVKETALKVFAGATTGDDKKYYGAEKLALINIGFTATKTVKVTESFNFPVFSTVALNPFTEQMYFVLGISL